MGLEARSLIQVHASTGKFCCEDKFQVCSRSLPFLAPLPLLFWEWVRFQAADNAALHGLPPSAGTVQGPTSLPAVLVTTTHHPHRSTGLKCYFPALQQQRGGRQLSSSHPAYLLPVALDLSLPCHIDTQSLYASLKDVLSFSQALGSISLSLLQQLQDQIQEGARNLY